MKLYEHQEQALEVTRGRSRVAYFYDMGLGKTYIGSEKMRELGYPVNLLVCQKSKVKDWYDHFKENYSNLLVYDITKPVGMAAFKQMSAFHGEKCVLGIINYELAWRREWLLTLHDFCLMLDESSLIQNRKAKQSKFILKLQPDAVILLSGTPTAGKYENLWTQAHLLGWNISEKLYNSQFVNWRKKVIGGLPIKYVDPDQPYKNVDRLKAKLRENGAVFMKTEDVLTMPEQNFIVQRVPVSKDYKHFMRNGIVTLSDAQEIVGDTTLTKRLRARQLCGQYSAEKLSAFRDLVESTKDRLIVFYNFTGELDAMREQVEKRPYSIVNGEMKDLRAYEQYSDSITFVQYQAGAMGLNLQLANKVIYFTLPERSELFEQSKKRIHRIGQERPCFYYILQCENSIEEHIYEALKQRKDYTDELFKTL